MTLPMLLFTSKAFQFKTLSVYHRIMIKGRKNSALLRGSLQGCKEDPEKKNKDYRKRYDPVFPFSPLEGQNLFPRIFH
jgi:hypothetical protein